MLKLVNLILYNSELHALQNKMEKLQDITVPHWTELHFIE